MSELLELLCGAVANESREDEVALLLSGGVDSLSVGIALQKTGKVVHAYTYRLQGRRSRDAEKASRIARHFGWPLTIVEVPTLHAADDFLRLATGHRCRKKVQFEVAFPLLYVFPRIEQSEVWTGWNADDHYGNSKNLILEQRQMARQGVSPDERKRVFDEWRRVRFEHDLTDPGSGQTWWYAQRLAVQHGKRLLDPYLDGGVREHFLQFSHDQLSPLTKPLVRRALADELRGLPRGSLAVGVRLQIGGGVDALFATLLQDDAINRFERRYTAVSPLCLRWGREVSSNPDQFFAELAALPPAPAAVTVVSATRSYTRFTMNEVRRSASRREFTVVSMFAGGGGSCIGYQCAGGDIRLANEFVPEAARTYRTNFPGTPVDQRDIREILAGGAEAEDSLALGGLRPGELDILDGSPPCCEFSHLGRGISDQSRLRAYSDVRQRGLATLIFDFFELATIARPKVVICENVPRLASRYGDLFDRAMDTLRFGSDHGDRLYYVGAAVLSADDFGVPQTRRRLFCIAVRADVAEAVGITNDGHVASLFPEPTHLPVSVRAALSDLKQTRVDFDPWHRAAMTNSVGRIIRQLPRAPNEWLKPHHVGLPHDKWFSLVRSAWELPAPTLTVAGQAPDGRSGMIHPEADRKFTVPELKRLFGLPDDYVLTGTLKQAAERICRMVPPLLIHAIAERVHERVLRPYEESRS